MPQASTNGISIEYEIEGPVDGPVLMMIHGLGAQLIRWHRDLCDRFIAEGFRILLLDNRDIGLSTYFGDDDVPDIVEVMRVRGEGRDPVLPYTLSDMAGDMAGLLDSLVIASAHVLGVSLGGMVAQVLAIEHPARVRSLAIMMSQSGNPDAPAASPETMAILATPAPDPNVDLEAYLVHQVRLNRALGGPDYPASDEELREFALKAARRAWNRHGSTRQLAAIRGAADRRAALRKLAVPTLVIHGADDPLILAECGEDIANNIAGSWFVRPRGMGHELPRELFGLFVATVVANSARSDR